MCLSLLCFVWTGLHRDDVESHGLHVHMVCSRAPMREKYSSTLLQHASPWLGQEVHSVSQSILRLQWLRAREIFFDFFGASEKLCSI